MIYLRQHRPFQAYWLSRVFTAAAFQILAVATGWQMYMLTGSALDLGLIGLLEFAPRVLFILQIGQVADRFDRRVTSALTKAMQAGVAALLCWLTLQHTLSRDVLLVLAFVLGTVRAFEVPAMAALLPGIVPPLLLPRSIAASASAMQMATIVAPAIGGVLFALDPAKTYGLSAVLMLIACALLGVLPKPAKAEQRSVRGLGHLLAGFAYIRRQRDLLGVISLDLFAVLLGGAAALLPIFASEILRVGPLGLGLLRAAPALGAILMSALLLYFPLNSQIGKKMFLAIAIYGVATLIFGVSTSLWLTLAALLVRGAADMVSMVIRASLIQIDTPDEVRGRVGAVSAVCSSAGNQLGEFESGLSAHFFGPQCAVVIGGVGTLLIAGIWMRRFPGLLARDKIKKV